MGLTRTLLVVGAGAALAYFLDPVSGPDRRRRLRRRLDERTPGTVGPLEVEPAATPTIVVSEPETPRPE
jgi:hypothetical protein